MAGSAVTQGRCQEKTVDVFLFHEAIHLLPGICLKLLQVLFVFRVARSQCSFVWALLSFSTPVLSFSTQRIYLLQIRFILFSRLNSGNPLGLFPSTTSFIFWHDISSHGICFFLWSAQTSLNVFRFFTSTVIFWNRKFQDCNLVGRRKWVAWHVVQKQLLPKRVQLESLRLRVTVLHYSL